ncbi:YbaB/EbfC family nucleoid-associated protein [Saccharopolyspora sp. MS10]|uniref:YbaB/EbfC family nucleoid-associated protein n=1 Tax=Saccharopolyspora sp. MS10 TaxID=3385973 RepID=UPI0039A16CAA
MSGVDRRNVEMLREEFERQVTKMADMKERMTELSATAVSPRRELQVTVGMHGHITELKFLTSGYRSLAKNEIAELITSTIAQAREKLDEQTAEFIAPMLPPGMNAQDLMRGDVAAGQMVPNEAMLPQVLRDRLAARRA